MIDEYVKKILDEKVTMYKQTSIHIQSLKRKALYFNSIK
ncbi:hypothetical protein [Acinetobacter bereziniae]|nr:hypothetical protein [Acinetobacter bereziniae]